MFSCAIRLIFGFSNQTAIIFSNSSSAPRLSRLRSIETTASLRPSARGSNFSMIIIPGVAAVEGLDEVQVCWAGLAMCALRNARFRSHSQVSRHRKPLEQHGPRHLIRGFDDPCFSHCQGPPSGTPLARRRRKRMIGEVDQGALDYVPRFVDDESEAPAPINKRQPNSTGDHVYHASTYA